MLMGTLIISDSPGFSVIVVGTSRIKITNPSEMFVRMSISSSLSLGLLILAETKGLSFGVIIAGHLKELSDLSLFIAALKTKASISPQIEKNPKKANKEVPRINNIKPIVRKGLFIMFVSITLIGEISIVVSLRYNEAGFPFL